MQLAPVPDTRALRLELGPDERDGPLVALVVAELHIGVETELSRAGAHIASGSQVLADRLIEQATAQDATRLIVAGDLKQQIYETTFQERRDVPAFLARLAAELDVHIILGNHDAGLRSLVPKHHDVVVHGPEGARFGGTPEGGGVGIFHGHAWPAPDLLRADELVSAHTHPAVALVDSNGHVDIEPCWVRATLDHNALTERYPTGPGSPTLRASHMTLLPPYNPLLGGAAVNVDGLLGPAGRMVQLPTAQLYLLDGTHLGTVEDLAPLPDTWRRRGKRPRSEDL